MRAQQLRRPGADVDLCAAQRSLFRRHSPHRERRARGLPPRGGVRALRRALCERRLDEGAGRAYADRHADASKRQLPRPAGHSHRQGRHGERPRSARHRPLRLHNSSRRRGADRKSPLARQPAAARAHHACRGQGQRHRAEPVRLPQRPLPLPRSDRHRRTDGRRRGGVHRRADRGDAVPRLQPEPCSARRRRGAPRDERRDRPRHACLLPTLRARHGGAASHRAAGRGLSKDIRVPHHSGGVRRRAGDCRRDRRASAQPDAAGGQRRTPSDARSPKASAPSSRPPR